MMWRMMFAFWSSQVIEKIIKKKVNYFFLDFRNSFTFSATHFAYYLNSSPSSFSFFKKLKAALLRILQTLGRSFLSNKIICSTIFFIFFEYASFLSFIFNLNFCVFSLLYCFATSLNKSYYCSLSLYKIRIFYIYGCSSNNSLYIVTPNAKISVSIHLPFPSSKISGARYSWVPISVF